MPTYKDFDSREMFIKSLELFHYNKSRDNDEFVVVPKFANNFSEDLQQIKNNIDVVKSTWHDQSIDQIEKSVAAMGARQLGIMLGQKKDKLMAGYQPDAPMYRIKNCEKNSVFFDLAQKIGLENAAARFHVQFPGEVTVWHTDIFSPAHEFLPEASRGVGDDSVGKDLGIRRVLIALEDWDWGHVLMFGASAWKQWQAGDLVAWDFGVPHCAANMGLTPRISVSITGLANQRYYDFIKNAGVKHEPDPISLDTQKFYFLSEFNRRVKIKMQEIKSQGHDVEQRLEYILLTLDHAMSRLEQICDSNGQGFENACHFYFGVIGEL